VSRRRSPLSLEFHRTTEGLVGVHPYCTCILLSSPLGLRITSKAARRRDALEKSQSNVGRTLVDDCSLLMHPSLMWITDHPRVCREQASTGYSHGPSISARRAHECI
jgi:hypothetical protein